VLGLRLWALPWVSVCFAYAICLPGLSRTTCACSRACSRACWRGLSQCTGGFVFTGVLSAARTAVMGVLLYVWLGFAVSACGLWDGRTASHAATCVGEQLLMLQGVLLRPQICSHLNAFITSASCRSHSICQKADCATCSVSTTGSKACSTTEHQAWLLCLPFKKELLLPYYA
jgi:hypothetical protein